LVTGSNPVSGATLQKPLNYGLSKEKSIPKANCDTSKKIYDTKFLRLYRVNEIYYYRRRIKQKLVRISLRTKNLKEALKRKKVLDLLKGEELFNLETKDFKLALEYETAEELRIILENTMRQQIEQEVQHYKEVKEHVQHQATSQIKLPKFPFAELKEKYIAQAVYDGNVKQSSIADYTGTFNRLIDYFNDRDINELTVQDIEAFKLHLSTLIFRGKNLSKKTINKHLIYTKQFLKFAIGRDFITKNVAEPVKLYNKKQTKAQEPKKVLYTKQEIKDILKYSHEDIDYKVLYHIALYTGMRQSEIRQINLEDIIKDPETGIYYIDIPESKSEAGARQIPIHSKLLPIIEQASFPLFNGLDMNAFGKKARYHLYKALGGQKGIKNFHTLRANFVDAIAENNKMNPNQFTPLIIQEICGHVKGEQNALTYDRYKGGFSLSDKKELIENISY